MSHGHAKKVEEEPIVKNTKDRVIYMGLPLSCNFDGYLIVKKYFSNVICALWDGKKETKKEYSKKVDSYDYEYLISFWNEYFIPARQFKKATKGAINFHPSCPEHPGLGFWSYPFAFPNKRQHHGSTMHEIDKKLDHGQIYQCTRWPVLQMEPADVCYCSVTETLKMLEDACKVLSKGVQTTELATKECENEKWNEQYFSHKQEFAWLATLPKGHIAHDCETFRIIDLMTEKYYPGYLRYEKHLWPEFKFNEAVKSEKEEIEGEN